MKTSQTEGVLDRLGGIGDKSIPNRIYIFNPHLGSLRRGDGPKTTWRRAFYDVETGPLRPETGPLRPETGHKRRETNLRRPAPCDMKMVARRSGPLTGSIFVAGRSRPFSGPITVARRYGLVSDGLRRTSF